MKISKEKNMKNGNLGFTKQKLNNILGALDRKYGVRIKFASDVPYLNGWTKSDMAKNKYVIYLGEYPLSKKLFFQKIPDEISLCMIANVHHELRHIHQMKDVFQKDYSEDALYMALCDLATKHNDIYYRKTASSKRDFGKSYLDNPCEINAELHGIRGLYDWLREEFTEFTDNQCEQVTLKYVNYKTYSLAQNLETGEHYDYYIPCGKLYHSLQDVYDVFGDIYKEAKYRSKFYFLNQNCKDMAMKFMHDFDEIYRRQNPRSDGYYQEHFVNMPKPMGLNQDRLVAAVTVKLHPEYQKYYKILEDMNLDLEHVLNHPVTETISLTKILTQDKFEK